MIKKLIILVCLISIISPGIVMGSFQDNGNGTVTDTETGLMWQQDTAPGTYTWQQALSYCEDLTFPPGGYSDWRLPNRNELQSIVDYSRYYPSIDPVFNAVASYYWSSTTYASHPDYAWYVHFYYGTVYHNHKSYNSYVRAVRAGQCGSFVDCDVSISPSSPPPVNSGEQIPFSASNAGSECTTPTNYEWSVSSSIGSQIDQNGNYTAGNNDTGEIATDIVTVVDHANYDIRDEVQVMVLTDISYTQCKIYSIDDINPDATDIYEGGTVYRLYQIEDEYDNDIAPISASIELNSSNGSPVAGETFIAEIPSPGMLQIGIVGDKLNIPLDNSTTLSFPDTITLGGHSIPIIVAPLSFQVNYTKRTYRQEWDIFAAGSAGITGGLGAHLGPVSVYAAKASISGEAGIGFKIIRDHEGALTLERRFGHGLAGSLSSPSFGIVVRIPPELLGGINVGGAREWINSQTINSNDPNSDTNKMINCAFTLETLSNAKLTISPHVRAVTQAIVETLNDLSGASQLILQSKIEEATGTGLEGNLFAGTGYIFTKPPFFGGKFVANAEVSGCLQCYQRMFYDYNLAQSAPTGFSREFSVGVSGSLLLDISLIPHLSYLNYYLNSSISGSWGESLYLLNNNETPSKFVINFETSDGSEFDIGVFETQDFESQYTEITFLDSTVLHSVINSPSLNANQFYMPTTIGILIDTVSLFNDINTTLAIAKNQADIDEAVGYTYSIDDKKGTFTSLDIDFGIGLGIGASIGIEAQYFNTLVYPDVREDVYYAGGEYPLQINTSTELPPSDTKTLSQVLIDDIFSGIGPLIEEAFLEIVNTVSDIIEDVGETIIDAIDNVGQKVGEVTFNAVYAGYNGLATVIPIDLPQIDTTPFGGSTVKMQYKTNRVVHQSKNLAQLPRLWQSEATTEKRLTIISKAVVVGLEDPQGEPVINLPTSITLTMKVFEDDLTRNDFEASDKTLVQIYYFDDGSQVWILVGGILDVEDNISTQIDVTGIYALGIEQTIAENDPDMDGLTTLEEDANGNDIVDEGETSPYDSDSDDDGLEDGAEVFDYGTDPTDPDSDDDGYNDGVEVHFGSDPLNQDSKPSDIDEDYIPDGWDNCVQTPNSLDLGTCIIGNIGQTCTIHGDCGDGGYCSMNQEDTYPPGGNGIGDACDCEGDFDCDGNVDATDITSFLADFGRSTYLNPCAIGNPCNGDFNCDLNVDAADVTVFLEDFGRSEFFNSCPACVAGNWCSY